MEIFACEEAGSEMTTNKDCKESDVFQIILGLYQRSEEESDFK